MNDHIRTVPTLTYDAAAVLVQEAIRHARANGWAIACAVVDPGGHILASGRMDGVAAPILDFATDKAFTSTLGRSTKGFFERMSSTPELAMGLGNRQRLCAWEGGLPIRHQGVLIAAIGVSGAAGHEDAACGQAALTSLGFGD